jgi:phosphoglycolate phosphatase
MKPVDLMIFDLDGTLINSGSDIAMSVNYTLRSLGLPAIEERVVLRYIGDGIRKLIERSLGPASQERLDEAIDIFSNHYHEHMLDSTALYPGVAETLQYFQDKKKAILTNKRRLFARLISDGLGISDFFDEILGADGASPIKPDARLVYPLLERFNALPERTVMIGDGVNDILLARNAGIMSCSFLKGLTDREILTRMHPDFCYEHFHELPRLFT